MGGWVGVGDNRIGVGLGGSGVFVGTGVGGGTVVAESTATPVGAAVIAACVEVDNAATSG
jgi:hypothetical protein